MMNVNRIVLLVVCITIPLVVGFIAGISTSQNIADWYTTLNKPSFNPPNSIFGPVWTVLYCLMGISLFIAVINSTGARRRNAIIAFSIQLLLNFSWSFVFFAFHKIRLALVVIALLLVSVIVMTKVFYDIKKPAGYLQIPYIAWLSFATALNTAIFYLN